MFDLARTVDEMKEEMEGCERKPAVRASVTQPVRKRAERPVAVLGKKTLIRVSL